MNFQEPLMFFLIIPIVALWGIPFFIKEKGIKHSSFENISITQGLKSKFAFLPSILILISLLLLIGVLAKPIKPPKNKNIKREGIAIELVIDNSSSMNELILDNLNLTRKLDAVKKAVIQFVAGNKKIDRRQDDLIGVISFARYANTIYPLTFNRGPFNDVIKTITIAEKKVDGTHFGAGLEMAVARLELLNQKKDSNIKSRIIIFLTDGINRIKEIDPLEVAQSAKKNKIPIYTIAFATEKQPILDHIAELTGGKSFSAKNSNLLKEIYIEIDKLEKSKLQDVGEQEGEPDSFKLLFVAFILILFSIVLELSIFRRFP